MNGHDDDRGNVAPSRSEIGSGTGDRNLWRAGRRSWAADLR